MRGLVEEQLREQTVTFMKNQERLLELVINEQTRSGARLRRALEQMQTVDVPSVLPNAPSPAHRVSTHGSTPSSPVSSVSDVTSVVPTIAMSESPASALGRRKDEIAAAFRVTSDGFSSQVRPVLSRDWSKNPSAALKAGKTRRVVDGYVFQTVVCAVIFLYIIFVGFEVNDEMSNAIGNHNYRKQEADTFTPKKGWITVVGYCFTSVFVLELSFRMVALKAQFLLGQGRLWNLFDSVLVLTSVVDPWLTTDSGQLPNVSYLRCFRMFWVFRALRLAKTVQSRFVRDFRMMMLAIVSSVIPLFWAVTTLAALHYLASIIVMMFVADYIANAAAGDATVGELTVWFESLPMSALTLFMAITGGVSWWEIMEPILVVGPLAGVILVCFIVVTVLAVLNIITGIFVNDAIEKARSDESLLLAREMEQNVEHRQQLKDLFRKLDVHRHGQISVQDFCEQLENREVQAIFSLMGIEVADASSFFRILDVDESQWVERDEFVMGCMRFKSRSTSVNVECSLMELKDMLRTCMKHMKHVKIDGNFSAHRAS